MTTEYSYFECDIEPAFVALWEEIVCCSGIQGRHGVAIYKAIGDF